MSDYRVTHQTDAYEMGVQGNEIIAACTCGHGFVTRNKGLGRASAATWRTRHQDCEPTPTPGHLAGTNRTEETP